MSEIISLQFGHYSNFVATHIWNSQGERWSHPFNSSYDCLFRAGENIEGRKTLTPRALIFDLKGSFKTLPKVNNLYKNPTKSSQILHHNVETFEEPPYIENAYLQSLDCPEKIKEHSKQYHIADDVEVWSDFNSMYYHPKSIIEISSYRHQDRLVPFNSFANGIDAFEKEQFVSNTRTLYEYSSLLRYVADLLMKGCNVLEENFRSFLEECDYFQGFQITVDFADGFGGFASKFLEGMNDYLSKATILTFGVLPSMPEDRFTKANAAFSFKSLCQNSSIFIPLSLASSSSISLLGHQENLPFTNSAVLAAAIDTLMVPFTESSSHYNLSQLTSILSITKSANVASLSSFFPLLPETKNHTNFEFLIEMFNGKSKIINQTPYDDESSLSVIRGNLFEGLNDQVKQEVRMNFENKLGSSLRNQIFYSDFPFTPSVTFPLTQENEKLDPRPFSAVSRVSSSAAITKSMMEFFYPRSMSQDKNIFKQLCSKSQGYLQMEDIDDMHEFFIKMAHSII